jgi:hypothetical protein
MNGFITESVGKISDGLFAAIKLVLGYYLIRLLLVLVELFFGMTGVVIFVFILMAFGAFYLYRSWAIAISEHKRAWRGMLAGLLFWQAFVMIADFGSFPLFERLGILFWVMLVLVMITLWKKIQPIGIKMSLALFLVCWIGKIYFTSLAQFGDWLPVLQLAFSAIRYLTIAAGIGAILFIIYRSWNAVSRGLAAIVIFNAILYLFRAF